MHEKNSVSPAKKKFFANDFWLRGALVVLVVVLLGSLVLRTDAIAGQDEASIAVVGSVVDSEGRAIESASVTITTHIQRPGKPMRLSTKTKADGSYSIEALPAKSSEIQVVSIRAYSDGFEIAQINMPSVGKSSDDMLANGSLVANFKLGKSEKTSVKLVNVEGEPVVGARLVTLTAKKPFSQQIFLSDGDWAPVGLEISPSNEQGVVQIPGLVLSTKYDFQFEHSDYARTPTWNTDLTHEKTEIVMDRGMEVEFVVNCKSEPKAVADAVVCVSISEEMGHQRIEVPVSPSGKANMRLRDRSATINVEHPTLQSRDWYFYRKERSLAFALHRTGLVKGRVVNEETGKGAQSVSVHLAANNRVVKSGYSDEQGYYQVIVAEGDYSANLSSYSELWKVSDKKESLTVKAGEVVTVPDFPVSPKPVIRGQVILPTGEPVANAIIVANFRDEPLLSDAEGNFALRPGHTGRIIPIHAWHPYQGFSKVVAVVTDDVQEIRIELQPEGSAVGAVKDESGVLVPNLIISLRNAVLYRE